MRLWRDIELELKKSEGLIDPDYIDSRINELCELEARRSGRRPPEATEAQVNAVIARITSQAQRKEPAKRLHPLIRVAAAACIVLVFSFAIFAFNYVYAKVTENCVMKEIEITLCCGTDFCPCSEENIEVNI